MKGNRDWGFVVVCPPTCPVVDCTVAAKSHQILSPYSFAAKTVVAEAARMDCRSSFQTDCCFVVAAVHFEQESPAVETGIPAVAAAALEEARKFGAPIEKWGDVAEGGLPWAVGFAQWNQTDLSDLLKGLLPPVWLELVAPVRSEYSEYFQASCLQQASVHHSSVHPFHLSCPSGPPSWPLAGPNIGVY